jgi:hypothetical protein
MSLVNARLVAKSSAATMAIRFMVFALGGAAAWRLVRHALVM